MNSRTADVGLEHVDANFAGTHLAASGSIAGEHGKVVSVDIDGDRGRIEDLLSMFTRSDRPALKGPIRLHAHADVLPGDDPFLRKLALRGSFAVSDARWTGSRTQIKVNALSARARGDKKEVEDRAADGVDLVMSQLKGDVSLKAGLARLSGLSFRVPGATATGAGTYSLITKRVDLKGSVSMTADVSEATSGFKSVLLKPFDKLFRRHKQSGATLPVSITGMYPKPEYRIGLTK